MGKKEGSQVTGSQVMGSQVTGSQVMGKQVTVKQAIGKQNIGKQDIKKQVRIRKQWKNTVFCICTILVLLASMLNDCMISMAADQGTMASHPYRDNETKDLGDDWDDDDDDSYCLLASTDYISFGTMNKGDKTTYQNIVIYNVGNRDASLIVDISTADHCISMDAVDGFSVPAGESAVFSIIMETDELGSHSATVYFADQSDPSYMRGVAINVSGTVVEPTPAVSSVSINPSNTSATKNSYLQFYASVFGNNSPSQEVTWTISGQKANSMISSDGRLYIASNETASQIKVTATSIADRSKSASATVNITKDTYTVSVSTSGGGSVTGGTTVQSGESATVTASPNSGYTFVNWTRDGNQVSTDARYTLKDIKENISLVANFKQNTFRIHTESNHSYGGSVTADMNVNYGANATITATANPGYKFEGWYEGNTRVSADVTYTVKNVTQNHNYVAIFTPNSYSITATASPAGSGTFTGLGNYDSGSNATLKASPVSGYEFAGWFVNGKEYSKNAQITINGLNQNYTFVAYFVKPNTTTFAITSSAGTNGTISPQGSYSVPQASNATYTIAPNAGYVIQDVKVDNVSVGAVTSYTFTNVQSKHTISATFAKRQDTAEQNQNSTQNQTNTQDQNDGQSQSGTQNQNTSGDSYRQQYSAETTNTGSNTQVPASYDSSSTDLSRDAETQNLDNETGAMQEYNITESEALDMLHHGGGRELFDSVIRDGTFDITVYNTMGNDMGSVQSVVEGEATLPNLAEVFPDLFTDQEMISILRGSKTNLSVNVFDNSSFIREEDKTLFAQTATENETVGAYFEVFLLKTIEGNTTEMTELANPLQIVINVPGSILAADRNYSVLRIHTGSNGYTTIDRLEDLDDEPSTITFASDKFSSYAIVYSDGTGGSAGESYSGTVNGSSATGKGKETASQAVEKEIRLKTALFIAGGIGILIVLIAIVKAILSADDGDE